MYTVPASGGRSTVITAANRGGDQNPVYSPDGRFIYFNSEQGADKPGQPEDLAPRERE